MLFTNGKSGRKVVLWVDDGLLSVLEKSHCREDLSDDLCEFNIYSITVKQTYGTKLFIVVYGTITVHSHPY